VRYLETVGSLEAVKQYKQTSYTLLGIRAGSRVLDVGCGAGDDARAMAGIVGPTGRVVGVDSSETMVAAARHRAEGSPNLEFRVGSAYRLEFPDAAFDAARANRMFQHLHEPQRALREMVRVAQPGGRVLVADPDWDTLVVNHRDGPVTRSILDHRRSRFPGPDVARHLPRPDLRC
jgi:ubiquinone/menaquinone biosynthesis C-methylase UbiE